MKILSNNMYLHLVDEKAEIKEGNLKICLNDNYISKYLSKQNIESDTKCSDCKKIIAYYPLSKEAKELDLPLLPNPFKEEVDIEEMVNKEASMYVEKYASYKHESYMYNECKRIFKAGYKAAQSKQFSLEDMLDAFEYGLSKPEFQLTRRLKEDFEKFIQSLSTQQLPKEFIPEYYTNGDMIVKNRNGVRELVGTYKY